MNDTSETFTEMFFGNIDVELMNGKIERGLNLYRHDKLKDPNDIESVYAREWVAFKRVNDSGDGIEYHLGDDKGQNLIIKERR